MTIILFIIIFVLIKFHFFFSLLWCYIQILILYIIYIPETYHLFSLFPLQNNNVYIFNYVMFLYVSFIYNPIPIRGHTL